MLNCEGLKVVFPEEREDFIKLAYEFQFKNSKGLIRGCVAGIVGFLAIINRQTFVQSANSLCAFFRSLYDLWNQCPGCFDAYSRFIYFGVIAPGRFSDQVTFEQSSIFDRVAAFDTGFDLVVSDAGYILSDVMLVPFAGSLLPYYPTQDAFNFILSQLWIQTIEMALGQWIAGMRRKTKSRMI